jgi:hypothetical protein
MKLHLCRDKCFVRFAFVSKPAPFEMVARAVVHIRKAGLPIRCRNSFNASAWLCHLFLPFVCFLGFDRLRPVAGK